MKIDEVGYEIKRVTLRSDKPLVRCLFVEGKRLTHKDKVEFTCQDCGKEVNLLVQSFLYKSEFLCRDCLRNKTRRESGWKMSESAKRAISESRKGHRILDYFDFTCPVCSKTFKYRNTARNRGKTVCSRKCQSEDFSRKYDFLPNWWRSYDV